MVVIQSEPGSEMFSLDKVSLSQWTRSRSGFYKLVDSFEARMQRKITFPPFASVSTRSTAEAGTSATGTQMKLSFYLTTNRFPILAMATDNSGGCERFGKLSCTFAWRLSSLPNSFQTFQSSCSERRSGAVRTDQYRCNEACVWPHKTLNSHCWPWPFKEFKGEARHHLSIIEP